MNSKEISQKIESIKKSVKQLCEMIDEKNQIIDRIDDIVFDSEVPAIDRLQMIAEIIMEHKMPF